MPTYPYSSGQTAVVQAFDRLRKGFPAKVDAAYLQRFSIAPANESYIISILRFLGLIDEEGNRVEANTGHFYAGDDEFKPGLEAILRTSYSQLFDEMGDEALTAGKPALTNWFRAADKTSDLVGQRQASTFQTLTAIAGHGDVPALRPSAAKKVAAPAASPKKAAPKKSIASKVDTKTPLLPPEDNQKPSAKTDVGLTVRIEVNLPPDADPETYDAIFASIKKHLMP